VAERARWQRSLARAALERFCLAYGSVAGDLALAQGATTVVLAGGLTQRLRDFLIRERFHERFTAKGRFEA
jgi:glucokinase